jgi:hypothetical protein
LKLPRPANDWRSWWPAGAQATFGPHLIVLDAEGNTLAQEGDHIDGACTFDSGVVLLGWP